MRDKRIRTLNLFKWEVKEIDGLGNNRSKFIREAGREQLEIDKRQGLLIEGGMEIISINIEIRVDEEIESLSDKGVFVSVSEFFRKAVRNKIIRERKCKKEMSLFFKDYDPKKEVRVPITDINDQDPDTIKFETYKLVGRA